MSLRFWARRPKRVRSRCLGDTRARAMSGMVMSILFPLAWRSGLRHVRLRHPRALRSLPRRPGALLSLLRLLCVLFWGPTPHRGGGGPPSVVLLLVLLLVPLCSPHAAVAAAAAAAAAAAVPTFVVAYELRLRVMLLFYENSNLTVDLASVVVVAAVVDGIEITFFETYPEQCLNFPPLLRLQYFQYQAD